MRGRILVLMAGSCLCVGMSAAPVHATFPGDDGRIAFSYEAPVPGEHVTQSDVWTIEPGGTDLTQLTDTPHRNEFAPQWNAEGTQLAFWRTKLPLGPGSIWVMDADGTDPIRLTEGIDARDPVWSPDGRRIAFSWGRAAGSSDIVTMRSTDGGGRRVITPWSTLAFEPAWSPDGRTIAMTRGFERRDVGDIWTVDLATGATTHVTSSPTYDHQVAWFADGSRLVFERVRWDHDQIVSVRPSGAGLRVLTSGHFDANPAPSPSGTAIAFVSDRLGSFFPDLWTMEPDGSNPQAIADLVFASTTPDWQAIPGD